MTAIRAHSAFETATARPATTTTAPAPAGPAPVAREAREIRLPGSSRTYELRDVLCGMGLRWDPCSHSWHGALSPDRRVLLERDLHLPVQAVVPIEAFSVGEQTATPRPEPPRGPSRPAPRPGGLGARPRARDGSRTRAEALVAFPDADQDSSPNVVRGRFSLLDITGGLADDSREADEHAAARRLADLRGRVKAARKAIQAVPGAATAMRADWRREAAFLARFGVTRGQFRQGVPADANEVYDADALKSLGAPLDSREEIAARAVATFLESDAPGRLRA